MSQTRKLRRQITYPLWCSDAWALHQMFRELGIPAEDLYFGIAETSLHGKQSVRVTAKEGTVEYTVSVGPARMAERKAISLWKKFVMSMNAATDAELRAIVHGSKLLDALPLGELLARLLAKGFALPDLPAEIRAAIEAPAGVAVQVDPKELS